MRVIWTAAGVAAFGLGLIGAVLPLLPTTPLMILAAFCFAKSSPRLHDWLVGHRVFGPAIRDWTSHRAIAPRAKRAALMAMAVALGISLVLGMRWEIVALQGAVLVVMGTFIVTRPDGPRA